MTRNSEKAEKEMREKQASRFNNVEPREEYKGDSNSRTRVGLPVEVRERSSSKTNGRSGVKDTREFVREL